MQAGAQQQRLASQLQLPVLGQLAPSLAGILHCQDLHRLLQMTPQRLKAKNFTPQDVQDYSNRMFTEYSKMLYFAARLKDRAVSGGGVNGTGITASTEAAAQQQQPQPPVNHPADQGGFPRPTNALGSMNMPVPQPPTHLMVHPVGCKNLTSQISVPQRVAEGGYSNVNKAAWKPSPLVLHVVSIIPPI